jgi:hypothetical protein
LEQTKLVIDLDPATFFASVFPSVIEEMSLEFDWTSTSFALAEHIDIMEFKS